ncbi:hypothetical protein [Vibrio alginolyticus]|uniref:hypothetical protein n=1 Tax=Vibrio alginolyticus TaxID=663 RepID=UPI001BD44FC7|nr:hypothetical protein [Vibrio alginolyticus]MBS9921627.1 hypothetical protein [Vibrio alginolyticus]
MSIEVTEQLRVKLELALNKVVQSLGPIQIGSKEQFPFGWRKAAKGRTVWRILEEAITQNLEYNFKNFGFSSVDAASSEVGVYDFSGKFDGIDVPFYVNIKSAVIGARSNKDDISKAIRLIEFFDQDEERNLFVASFLIKFNDDMSVTVEQAIVMPTMWLPDIYVNPSNNGNLQSSKYKYLDQAVRRSNGEFIQALKDEIEVAKRKRALKAK